MTPVYGWAQSTIRALCESDSHNIAFCLDADNVTRLYILLAIRGWQRKSIDMDFPEFARELSRSGRRALLEKLWGFDLGSLTPLKHCSGAQWGASALDRLAISLGDPHHRLVLSRQTRVTPKILRSLREAPLDASAQELDLIVQYGPKITRYLVEGLNRRGVAPVQTTTALRRGKPAGYIDEMVHKLLADAPMPPPPWAGNAMIQPIETIRDIRKTGQAFRNCLADVGYGLRALINSTAFYVADLDGRKFCIRLKHDRLLQQWRVSEIKGVANAKPTAGQLRKLVSAFEEAGLPYIPRLPFEYWFDG